MNHVDANNLMADSLLRREESHRQDPIVSAIRELRHDQWRHRPIGLEPLSADQRSQLFVLLHDGNRLAEFLIIWYGLSR